jgi:hypothetical protein
MRKLREPIWFLHPSSITHIILVCESMGISNPPFTPLITQKKRRAGYAKPSSYYTISTSSIKNLLVNIMWLVIAACQPFYMQNFRLPLHESPWLRDFHGNNTWRAPSDVTSFTLSTNSIFFGIPLEIAFRRIMGAISISSAPRHVESTQYSAQ